MSKPSLTINRQSWLLLIVLSVLWGGSFFFGAIALRELPPMTLALGMAGFLLLALGVFLVALRKYRAARET